MKLKQLIRYEMCFEGKWPDFCAAFMGVSFFLRILYYFGFLNLNDISGGEIFVSLILPLLLCCVFIVIFRLIKWNAPGIYAILGSAFCLLMLIWNFSSGDILRILLGTFMYIIAAVALLAAAGGYLPSKLIATVIFGAIAVFRFCNYSLEQPNIGAYIFEFSSISIIVSLVALTLCFKPRIHHNKSKCI